MSRKDAVSPELALLVLRRDEGCVAPRLGGSFHDCWGRNGIEHVKAEPRMGKRAEPLASRLVTLCDGHREPGMKAGRVWCTTRENREAMRAYLAGLEAVQNGRRFIGCELKRSYYEAACRNIDRAANIQTLGLFAEIA